MRVKLKKGEQRKLIAATMQKHNSLNTVAQRLQIPYPTLKNYFQENMLLPKEIFEKLLKLSHKKEKDFEASYLPENWGKRIGGQKGAKTLLRKYKRELVEWRKKGISKFHYSNAKQIKIPILDERLAEFIGAHLGDGTLTKYFLKISGDARYDLPYFNYLQKLIFDIFGIDAHILKENDKTRNTLYLTISSKNFCMFLHDKFGIEYGDKIRNNTLIPKSILQSSKLSLACLRGLIDTDGSISRRGRDGSQFCIVFTSHNKNLIRQVKQISDKHDLFSYVSKDETQIGTNKGENILNYFRKVGSSNLRHIVRFYLRFFENKTIYRHEVTQYYQKDLYRNAILPFKIKGPVV